MKLLLIFLVTSMMFGQHSIVAGGNKTETFGEVLFNMQKFDTVVEEVKLGIPKFDLPVERPVIVVVKKKSFMQRLLELLKNLFK